MKNWLKILCARLLDKKFILFYPDGQRTYRLPWEQVEPLKALHGGRIEAVWSE